MFKNAQTSLMLTARRTEISDAVEISSLVSKSTLEIFGSGCKETGRLFELIEKSVLSITLEDQSNKRILAQACFNDFPNVHGVSARSWEAWLNERYDAVKNSSLNTLFLHFYAAQPEYSFACAEEIIKSAFKAVPECHYIILCVPVNTVPDSSLANIFNEMSRLKVKSDQASLDPKCVVLIANRDKHLPVLHIRTSNVNDNDDLIPLLNSYTSLLKATYGEFYVAEMIEAQNDLNKCLTAEAEGLGIGFMAITQDVNVELLNECFELVPFHGLCKPHPNDVLKSAIEEEDESPAELPEHHYEPVVAIKHKLSNAGIIDSDELGSSFNVGIDDEQGKLFSREKSRLNGSKKHHAKSINFTPKYAGEANAFAIQLFCIDEKYDSRSLDFLPKAFEAFPDKDYCLITLPPNVPEFSLIQNFLRVTPRDTNKINQELYIFHRAGLIKTFDIREATRPSDYGAVEKLVSNLRSKEAILKDLKVFQKSRKDANGVDVQAFVAEALGRVVGVAIVRQEEDIEYLRSNYNIEDFILYEQHKREEHGHVNHFAVIPIFSFLTKYFIREIMRKSKKTCLYYPIYPEYVNDDVAERYSLITAMNYMVPVRKRTQIEYNFERLGVNAPSDQVLKPKYNYFMPFALNHINRKLVFEPKIVINLRIVVVGASEVGISFLETLAFSPHLRFNNLTLVATNGLPGSLSSDQLRERLLAQTLNYTNDDHAAMSLRSWINVVCGKLTSIDRRRKHITINNMNVLPYDHLVLCTGVQYYHIAPLQAKVYNALTKQEIKSNPTRPLFDTPPPNMFVLNDEFDAENVFEFIERNNLSRAKESLIVYGVDLNALCTVQVLLEMGIDPGRIKIVCEKQAIFNVLNNSTVSAAILEELHNMKVDIYEDYIMQEWNDATWTSGAFLKSVFFKKAQSSPRDEKSPRNLSIDCCALFCFYKKDVDYTTFIAINKCHLVYDGLLVIDNDFHTNDSCIRAGGKLTKFKRSYYVDSWSHACFNQKEIGVDMAFKLLKLIDPLLADDEKKNYKTDSARIRDNEPDESVLIKLYKKPLVHFAVLPGDYYYLNVNKPGLRTSFDDENVETHELVTQTENGYFRIHLGKNKCVQTITCLSKKLFNVSNLIKIYGFHEKYLNDLLLKYNKGSIKDFYNFFSENWCTALFHDRFEELRKEIRDISINPKNGIKSVNDLLKEYVDKDLILTKEQRTKINEHFANSGTRSLIEKRLLSYLNYNYYHLPMYAKPDMV